MQAPLSRRRREPSGSYVRILAFVSFTVSALTACFGTEPADGLDDSEDPSSVPTGVIEQAATPAPNDCPTGSENLIVYTRKCVNAMKGHVIPAFNCDAIRSVAVPDTGSHIVAGDEVCDRPNVLNHECDPGSRFQVLLDADDIQIVAHCRSRGQHVGPSGPLYNDVAMIAYNRKSGDTCFFQSVLDADITGDMPSPQDYVEPPAVSKWQSPAAVANINCVSCHDNGPFIRTPYFTQLKATPLTEVGNTALEWSAITSAQAEAANDNAVLPGSRDATANRAQPYRFVGADFQKWKAYAVTYGNNTCISCHRMGVSSKDNSAGTPIFNVNSGTALVFGPESTNTFQQQKNPHGTGGLLDSTHSPIWMKQNQVVFDPSSYLAAQEMRACANAAVTAGPGGTPSLPNCHITQIAQGDQCGGAATSITVNGSTNAAPTTTPQDVTVDIPLGPDTAFPYITSLHGPFTEASYNSRLDDPTTNPFNGTFLAVRVVNGSFRIRAGWLGPTPSSPRPGAGGTIEFARYSDFSAVSSPNSCTYSINHIEDLVASQNIQQVQVDTIPQQKANTVTGLIGTVSYGSLTSRFELLRSSGSELLKKTYGASGTYEGEAWSGDCPSWTPVYLTTELTTTSDVRLLPADSAGRALCFISGIGGQWSSTAMNGTLQPYAQIYTSTTGEIRLRVVPVSASLQISATATCLQLRPL